LILVGRLVLIGPSGVPFVSLRAAFSAAREGDLIDFGLSRVAFLGVAALRPRSREQGPGPMRNHSPSGRRDGRGKFQSKPSAFCSRPGWWSAACCHLPFRCRLSLR